MNKTRREDFNAFFAVLMPGRVNDIDLRTTATSEDTHPGTPTYAVFNANIISDDDMMATLAEMNRGRSGVSTGAILSRNNLLASFYDSFQALERHRLKFCSISACFSGAMALPSRQRANASGSMLIQGSPRWVPLSTYNSTTWPPSLYSASKRPVRWTSNPRSLRTPCLLSQVNMSLCSKV